jgi:integrase
LPLFGRFGRAAPKDLLSPEQIEHLLQAAEGDWKGLILSGYFTGGRLVDLARLTWGDTDLSEKTITFVQRKTGSPVQVPIHQDLYEYLLELPCSRRNSRPEHSLGNRVERAGIEDGVARKKDGKLGRNVSRLSFHSLRHSFNSAMANADVPLEIRQKLTGHASKDMNRHYTHLELATVRRAVESISRLPGKAADTPQ